MPFNLSQIFGGWRKKESVGRRASDFGRKKGRSIPPPSPSLTKGGGEREGYSASEPNKSATPSIKSKSELARKLLVAPHISEKATMLGDGRYVFKVADGANKNALKKAVQDRYGVEVLFVNTIAERGKTRRRGQIVGVKSGFKKAIVTLKVGQVISEF